MTARSADTAADLAAHIRGCSVCASEAVLAATLDEELPLTLLAGYIESAHLVRRFDTPAVHAALDAFQRGRRFGT